MVSVEAVDVDNASSDAKVIDLYNVPRDHRSNNPTRKTLRVLFATQDFKIVLVDMLWTLMNIAWQVVDSKLATDGPAKI